MLTSKEVDLRFFFAATFEIVEEDATARLRYQVARPYGRSEYMQVEKWAIEDDLNNLADLVDGCRLLLDCEQVRHHEYLPEPEMLCVVLGPDKRYGRNLTPNLPIANHRYGECIIGHMRFRIEDGYSTLFRIDYAYKNST